MSPGTFSPEEEGKENGEDLGPLEMGSLPSDGPARLLRGVAAADAAGSSFVRRLPSESSGGEGTAAPRTRNSRRPTPSGPTRLTAPLVSVSPWLSSVFSVF